MTEGESRDKILKCQAIISGNWVTTSDVASMLCITVSMAGYLLRKMVDEQMLVCRKPMKRQGSIRYSKPVKLSGSWRKSSNEELGIEV
jgi:hypothetical protein